MKVALYNRYWSTGGGAEKYGAAIAELLAADHSVDLLVHESVDLGWLGERLQVDLSRVGQVEVDDRPGAVALASDGYDLLVNVSFMSPDRSRAAHSLYVVHFPTSPSAHLTVPQRAIVKAMAPLRGTMPTGMEWGEGFHHRDHGRRSTMWTSGDAALRFYTEPGRVVDVELRFADQRPDAVRDTTVTVLVDDEEVLSVPLATRQGRVSALRGTPARFSVSSREHGLPTEVRIVSDTFVPAEIVGGDDRRELGVPLRSIRIGSGLYSRMATAFPVLLSRAADTAWIESYDALVANSEFTRTWIDRYWGVDAEVLYPPVSRQPRLDKDAIILGVGRFFPASFGHSKKQLEMVKTFTRMCDEGVTGWTLHLVGGCAETAQDYLAEVTAAASGYPVELHVNAPGAELRDLYGRAAIYWHCAGLGEHPERHPDRLEHFGITTVEAMSAGAVPVVFAAAGQLETVRHGVDGYHFRTLRELDDLTQLLIGDEAMRARMADSSEDRARAFSMDAFGERLSTIVRRITAETPN